MTDMKVLTQRSLHLAAELLIEASPIHQTTSLEVKDLLRFLGYDAIQSQVSGEMPIAAVMHGWFVSTAEKDGKEFLVYSEENLDIYEEEEDDYDYEDEDDEDEVVQIFVFRI